MIYRERTAVVCVHRDQLLVCRFCDPTSNRVMLVVPGGGLEPDESPQDCALRETLEETGYRVRITADAGPSNYDFTWDGQLYHCHTHWFQAVLDPQEQAPDPVDDASYNWGPGWLPLHEIASAFAYNAHISHKIQAFTLSS